MKWRKRIEYVSGNYNRRIINRLSTNHDMVPPDEIQTSPGWAVLGAVLWVPIIESAPGSFR
jgi:hypothetical protein